MSEVRPWMRRAAEKYFGPIACESPDEYDNLVFAIAAHAPPVEEMVEALRANQFGFNHRRCSLCAGWNMSQNGETDNVHTKDCIVGRALIAYDSWLAKQEER